jgi:hypothetical protein
MKQKILQSMRKRRRISTPVTYVRIAKTEYLLGK